MLPLRHILQRATGWLEQASAGSRGQRRRRRRLRSHVRKLLGVSVSEEEILHTIVLALTTIGFPATNAALSWAEEVLTEEA